MDSDWKEELSEALKKAHREGMSEGKGDKRGMENLTWGETLFAVLVAVCSMAVVIVFYETIGEFVSWLS